MNREENPHRNTIGVFGLGATLVATGGLCVLTVPFLRTFSGAPYVASAEHARRAINSHLRAIRESKTGVLRFTDLGSGSGELVIDAAQTGFVARGVELNPWLVAASRWRAWRASATQASFSRSCLWATSLRDANVVTVFGVPAMMNRLAEKVKEECKPGTSIVSNTFPLPQPWKPQRISSGVYFYVVHERNMVEEVKKESLSD